MHPFFLKTLMNLRRRAWTVWGKIRGSTQGTLAPSAPRKLHLGCGTIRAPGWTNVDAQWTPATDLLDDVSTLKHVPRKWADAVYACHVLEHFSQAEVRGVVQTWFDVLRPGGELRISVPDMDRITRIYQENLKHFHTPGNEPWSGLIYGGQLDPYDFHKNGFNFVSMKHLLESVGFADVAEYAHQPHFIPGQKDGSLANEPFKQFISLNVRATRPA